ncbi:aspartate--tRNA(Asn) ligase [Brachybacterium phenoliresistens]|uniref:aspartate--tRNA(Asn) ligase n=1 Tax=Brachybacterium phenoliresistens TaxID=396014 RepID=UPI0031D5EE1C
MTPVPVPAVRTLAADLAQVPPGEVVTVRGHVHRRRELSAVAFLVVRDRSGLVQAVVDRAGGTAALPPEETPVEVTGTLSTNPKAPGGHEITAPRITPLGDPAATPPVEIWRPALTASLPTLLDHADVAWRHRTQQARWRLAAQSLRAFRETLDAQGFTEILTPKLVGGATESGAGLFAVDYFGREAFLAQSPQLYKQQLVGAFERVYEIGPVFRAEPHDTVRHLAQYSSMDVELGFVRDHRDVLDVLVGVLRAMVQGLAQRAAAELDLLDVELPRIPQEVPVIRFADALALLGADPAEEDLSPEHERELGRWARAEHDSDLLAVEGYPLAKRPFYTHPWTGPQIPGGPWSNSFDLLFRGVELVTGGQRLHRHRDYLSALAERGMSAAAHADYLRAFEHGMPPHGGFAIGLERWVSRLIGAANVREVALFPRDLHRLAP